MFILCATSWAIDITILWLELCVALPSRMSDPETSDSVYRRVYGMMGLLGYAQECCFLLNIVIGDCVVLWRAFVLWGRPRWLLRTASVLVFLSLVFDAFYLVILAASDLENAHIPAVLAESGVLKLGAKGLAWALTGITNILAISLIGYKTWRHWKDVVALVQRKTNTTLGMMGVVVETSVIYLLAWLMSVLAGEFVFGTYPYYLNWYFVMPITGMYPTLVIVLVAGRSSLLESGVTKIQASGGKVDIETATSMHFASRPPAQSIVTGLSGPELDISFPPPGGRSSISDARTPTSHTDSKESWGSLRHERLSA
ncbi:hypothetical protein K488DRAFT_67567 [Vararia minispora EC-137]|uniref:Uncharacterized protein n=1 Tax=Vararia minispora EC-137 TaxID=1314806 RepID=A0ACB8QY38_9AGAM|nr:hypothetical protein K488DRAFT_67567 [Vararia minispora EC-137]